MSSKADLWSALSRVSLSFSFFFIFLGGTGLPKVVLHFIKKLVFYLRFFSKYEDRLVTPHLPSD